MLPLSPALCPATARDRAAMASSSRVTTGGIRSKPAVVRRVCASKTSVTACIIEAS